MKILLINNNPVVSRLTALSARKEDIEIDEIQEVTELSSDTYDIVFVDGDSFSKDVRDVIAENMKVKKTVLFYAEDDEEEKSSFDLSILKPFLPSEVSAVIRSVEDLEEVSVEQEKIVEDFNVFENEKKEPREELFRLDDDVLLDEKVEEKKEEVKSSFDEKLEEAFPLKINGLDDEEESKKEEIELALDEELFSPLSSDNKIEEKEELLEFDLDDKLFEEKEEPKMEERLKEEKLFTLDEEVVAPTTKILDESEIENIKGLLSEDNSSEMALEDLMTPAPLLEKVDEKEEEVVVAKAEKKKSKKSTKKVDDEAVMQTLSSLSMESLRELLAGATVNIKIKFPKAK